MRQRFGSIMMLHDRGELRTGFRALRLTVIYHAPGQEHGHGIGKRLVATQADGGLAGVIDALGTRLR